MAELKTGKTGNTATIEYLVHELKQKHANFILSHDGEWIDVHVSKVGYDEKLDRARLDKLLKGIRIEPAGNPGK